MLDVATAIHVSKIPRGSWSLGELQGASSRLQVPGVPTCDRPTSPASSKGTQCCDTRTHPQRACAALRCACRRASQGEGLGDAFFSHIGACDLPCGALKRAASGCVLFVLLSMRHAHFTHSSRSFWAARSVAVRSGGMVMLGDSNVSTRACSVGTTTPMSEASSSTCRCAHSTRTTLCTSSV